MRKLILVIMLAALLLSGIQFGFAQTTPVSPTSNVQIYFVACEAQGVIDLSGTMQTGYDVFFQMFSGPNGTGTALTALRQVSVNGTYAVSEAVPYLNDAKVAAGTAASVAVSIARESNSSSTIYDTTVNDLQDGCSQPQNPAVTSTDLGSTEAATIGTPVPGSGILSPFGGELNPGIEPQPLVKIGARPEPGRTANPGLIFAECDKYPLANPGIIYDTDDLIVFWSWFAKTPALVQDHIDHAQYAVFLNGETFPVVERTEITQRGSNYWVFYIARIGRFWRPGSYGVSYTLFWDAPISDGYNDFGPGTENEKEYSTCTFEVQPNPYGIAVSYAAPPIPVPPTPAP